MRSIRWAVPACTLLLCAAAARAGDSALYADGDIEVSVEFDSSMAGSHGYSAYPLLLVNHSKHRSHKVTLKLPADSYGAMGDVLRSLTRTVEMPADSRVRVTLLQPPYPPVQGNNLEVRVDGLGSDRKLQLITASASGGSYMVRGGGTYPTLSGAGPGSLVLHSQNVNLTLPESARPRALPLPAGGAGGPGVPPGFGGPAGGAGPGMAPGAVVFDPLGSTRRHRADGPLDGWDTNWLAYSRYDGIAVTGKELADAPASVQTALFQYAETGGTLVLVGNDHPALPASWSRTPAEQDQGMTIYPQAGFGRCVVCPDGKWTQGRFFVLNVLFNDTANPWRNPLSAGDANRQFHVVDEAGVPVGGLFVLMIVFTIVIGPVNLWLLGRKDRRMWMLWTVPAISALTCAAVFGYMLISEGWNGHLRTEAITLLDDTTHRATTYGWTAFYAPLTPGDGLHFSTDTELMWQKSMDVYRYNPGGSSCTIDWSQDQHLDSGWVSARVPSHFRLRKSEVRRERLSITHGKEGSLTVLNALGADVKTVWLADEKGQVYTAEDIPTGRQVALTLNKDVGLVRKALTPPRALFTTHAWLTGGEVPPSPRASGGRPGPATKTGMTAPAFGPPTMKAGPPPPKAIAPPPKVHGAPTGAAGEPPVPPGRVVPQPPEYTGPANPASQPVRFLAPLTYVAVLEGSCPFVEDGLANTKYRQYRSIVIGTLKEPDDAN
jgi:hypothetical protein